VSESVGETQVNALVATPLIRANAVGVVPTWSDESVPSPATPSTRLPNASTASTTTPLASPAKAHGSSTSTSRPISAPACTSMSAELPNTIPPCPASIAVVPARVSDARASAEPLVSSATEGGTSVPVASVRSMIPSDWST
jgi:hypothetical protein